MLAVALVAILAGTACNSRDNPTPEDQTANKSLDSAMKVWRARREAADSLLKAAPPVQDVVKQLGGKLYDVAEPDIEAAVIRESAKTADCYAQTRRDLDPDLSIVLYVLVNYGAAGWDLVRVERWNATSQNGGAVVSCINSRAKAEWKLPTGNVKPGAHLVKITYTPPDSSKGKTP